MSTEQGLPNETFGTLKSDHERNTRRNRTFLIVLVAGGLLAIVAGPLMRSRGVNGGICVSGFGLLLLVLAGWSLYVSLRDRDLRVRVYDGGLVQTRAGVDRRIPWHDITSVNHTVMRTRGTGMTARTTHLCTLQIGEGETLQFSDATLEDVEGLCHAVQEGTRSFILEDVKTRLRAGETVAFGKLVASQDGLRTGQEMIPWSEIEDVRPEAGWVAVRINGVWRNLATTGRVNNAHVLSALVDRIRVSDEII